MYLYAEGSVVEERERDWGRKYAVFVSIDWEPFLKVEKSVGIFKWKVKNQYRKSCRYNILVILQAQMGKIVTLTVFLWIISFSNIWGNGKTSKVQKYWSSRPWNSFKNLYLLDMFFLNSVNIFTKLTIKVITDLEYNINE